MNAGTCRDRRLRAVLLRRPDAADDDLLVKVVVDLVGPLGGDERARVRSELVGAPADVEPAAPGDDVQHFLLARELTRGRSSPPEALDALHEALRRRSGAYGDPHRGGIAGS